MVVIAHEAAEQFRLYTGVELTPRGLRRRLGELVSRRRSSPREDSMQ